MMHTDNKSIFYQNISWHQRAWQACIVRALQSMNTKLLLEIMRTCSKHHGKIANDNRFTYLEKILSMAKQHHIAMFGASKQHAT